MNDSGKIVEQSPVSQDYNFLIPLIHFARQIKPNVNLTEQDRLIESMQSELEKVQEYIRNNHKQSPAVKVPDNFNGDDRKLIECATALLELDAKGVLVPNGLGGHARTIIESFVSRASNLSPSITEQDVRAFFAEWDQLMNINYSPLDDNYWRSFMERGGRALLDKLTGDKNAQ